MARVAEAARFAKLLAMLAHEARLGRTCGDIDPYGDHDRDLPRQARSRAQSPTSASLPLPCASSVADCNLHYLLIRGHSRSGGSRLPDEAQLLQGARRSPSSGEAQPYPRFTKKSELTLQEDRR